MWLLKHSQGAGFFLLCNLIGGPPKPIFRPPKGQFRVKWPPKPQSAEILSKFQQNWCWEPSFKTPRCYVFGIIGKLFKNVREWCLFHTDILKTCPVIQLLNLNFFKISVRFQEYFVIFLVPEFQTILNFSSDDTVPTEEIQCSFSVSPWFYHDDYAKDKDTRQSL